jgi:hypothetical protein
MQLGLRLAAAARRSATSQRRTSPCSPTLQPLADGPLSHPERRRNSSLLPAVKGQLPGAQPSSFTPLGWLLRAV